MVNGLTLAVELATQHLGGDGHLEHIAGELAMGVRVVNVSSTLKDLSNKSKVELSLLIQRGEERAHSFDTPSLTGLFGHKELVAADLPGRQPFYQRSQVLDPFWWSHCRASR